MRKSLSEIAREYENLRTNFGGQSAILSEVKRFAVGASHNSAMADQMLKLFFGNVRMHEIAATPKCFVTASAVDVFPAQPYVFRNYGECIIDFALSPPLGAVCCVS
jgi:hypothetical protein